MIKTDLVDIDMSNNGVSLAETYVSSKSMGASLISLDDVLQSQKMEIHEKISVNLSSVEVSRIDQIKIVIHRTQKSRGSSYIPTPEPYSSAKCGLINIQNDDDKWFLLVCEISCFNQRKTL